MRAEMTKVFFLLAGAGALALGTNILRPDPLPWLHTSEVRLLAQAGELAQLRTEPTAWVDARTWEAFVAGHVAGAVNLPAGQKFQQLARLFEMLAPQGPVVIYGKDALDADGREIAEFMVQNGYAPEQIYLFTPGWDGLEKIASVATAQGEQP